MKCRRSLTVALVFLTFPSALAQNRQGQHHANMPLANRPTTVQPPGRANMPLANRPTFVHPRPQFGTPHSGAHFGSAHPGGSAIFDTRLPHSRAIITTPYVWVGPYAGGYGGLAATGSLSVGINCGGVGYGGYGYAYGGYGRSTYPFFVNRFPPYALRDEYGEVAVCPPPYVPDVLEPADFNPEYPDRPAIPPEPPQASLPPPADEQRQAEAAALLRDADRDFMKPNYTDARDKYLRALVLDGESPRALLAYGLAELALGGFDDAVTPIRKALALRPELALSTYDLRRVFSKPDDLTRRIDELHALAGNVPDNADRQLLLGFCEFFGGSPSAGRAALDAYDKLRPDDRLLAEFIANIRRVSPQPGGISPSTPAPRADPAPKPK